MKCVAYHSYSDPTDFQKIHMHEMAERGFDTILFAVDETQWRYNLDNVKKMRSVAEFFGFDTWAGPWGLSGMFAGEAVSSYTNDMDGRLAFELWKQDMIHKAGFRTLFLDEPKLPIGYNDTNTLYDWYWQQRFSTPEGVKLTTSLPDDTFQSMNSVQIGTLPVDSLGLSCYHWTDSKVKVIQRSSDLIDRLVRLRPNDSHVWIQLFDLPEGSEWIPGTVKDVADNYGVADLAYWSFRAARATSSKTAHNWQEVWNGLH